MERDIEKARQMGRSGYLLQYQLDMLEAIKGDDRLQVQQMPYGTGKTIHIDVESFTVSNGMLRYNSVITVSGPHCATIPKRPKPWHKWTEKKVRPKRK